jgi:hypothetical protein
MRSTLTVSMLALAGLVGCSDSQPHRERVVRREVVYSEPQEVRYEESAPPPAPIVEVIPARPSRHAVWEQGHWVRDHHRWVWVHGYWR